MEGFAFPNLELFFGEYGNIKNCGKPKSGNLDQTYFDKNGRKYTQKKHHAWAGCYYSFGAMPPPYCTAIIGTKVLRTTPSPPPPPYP